ncbi:hypothetical protein [Caballeronia sp.]|uniref:hypothetical protein n=1 Tax=Caballeronia sp. TaxID=1931223 RepID=UPI003C48B21C
MAASSKSNHIWPAYVDMMTVLLMVYMLLSMIFQVLAALATPSSGTPDAPPVSNATSAEPTSVSHAAVMDDSLTQLPTDFVASVGRDENFLQPAQRAATRAWMSRNEQAIRARGFLVFSLTGTAEAPLGVRLRMQFERSLMVVSIADELKIPRDRIELRNPVPEQSTQDSIVLRLK